MREFSNCLNALFALLALPLYLFAALAALVGGFLVLFSPDWLPAWLQFVATKTFFIVAIGLILWFVLATQFGSNRMGADMVWADTLFGDGISGYLLFAGLVVAAVVLKLTLF